MKVSPSHRSPGWRSFHSRRPVAEKLYHWVCYVSAARAASTCHWSWAAVGDNQRPTEGNSSCSGVAMLQCKLLYQSTSLYFTTYCTMRTLLYTDMCLVAKVIALMFQVLSTQFDQRQLPVESMVQCSSGKLATIIFGGTQNFRIKH